MKQLAAFLIFISSTLASSAQEEAANLSHFEIGLNATAFINQYLDFGSGNGELTSPYVLTLEKRFGKFGIRAGFGVDGNRDKEDPPNGEPTAPTLNIHELQLNARTGLVLYQPLSPRWDLKYGCDAAFGYDQNKNWTEITNFFGERVVNTNSDLEWSLGLNPFVFAQFHLSDKFSLATELLLDISYRQVVEKTQSSEFPEFDVRQQTTGLRYGLNPPIALFFIFRL